MPARRFIQCDVFSPTPTKGNGLAVIVDADGLDAAQMQDFAAWTNLAETSFLLPPEDEMADYRVRIFTPYQELPFAGHPTLGSCAAWLHSGGEPKQEGLVRQECGVGIVEIDTGEDRLAFAAPPTSISPLPADRFEEIIGNLGIPPEAVLRTIRLDNGPVWLRRLTVVNRRTLRIPDQPEGARPAAPVYQTSYPARLVPFRDPFRLQGLVSVAP